LLFVCPYIAVKPYTDFFFLVAGINTNTRTDRKDLLIIYCWCCCTI